MGSGVLLYTARYRICSALFAFNARLTIKAIRRNTNGATSLMMVARLLRHATSTASKHKPIRSGVNSGFLRIPLVMCYQHLHMIHCKPDEW
jgi:hypothetical protein